MIEDSAATKTKPMRYIQRLDQHIHAWKVALKRKGKEVHRYFTDSEYGGLPQSLAAAMAWRDELFEKLSGADYAIWRRNVARSHNTTGIIGVYRGSYGHKSGKGTVRTYYWQAYWLNADGKRKSLSFGINKYGEDQAKKLAIKARREGLAEVAAEFSSRGLTTAKTANTKTARQA
jgi:hypothetical protein